MKIKWPKMPNLIVWNRVKALRQNKNLTQAEVANNADISITTLYFIEQGFDKKITKETKRKLADFFNCNVSDIFPAEMWGNITREEFFKSHKK